MTAAQRFVGQVEVPLLQSGPLGQTISLSAWRDVFGDLPSQIATRFRQFVLELTATPGHRGMPWLKDELRML